MAKKTRHDDETLRFQPDDPGIRINCPYCGEAIIYVRTDGDTYTYKCLRHGRLILPPDGHVRQQPH